MLKPLIFITLASIGTVMLPGCASIYEAATGDTVKANEIRTGFNTDKSFAHNVLHQMVHVVAMNDFTYEDDPDQFNATLQDPKFYFYYWKPIEEATNSKKFEAPKPVACTYTRSRQKELQGDMARSVTSFGGPSVFSAAASVYSLFTLGDVSCPENDKHLIDPYYDFMSDQVLIYVPQSKYPNAHEAEQSVYEAIKTAFEKGAPSVSKEPIQFKLEKGCERNRIRAFMKDDPNDVLMELYLGRLVMGDETIPNCEKPTLSFLMPERSLDVLAYMNHGVKEKAWVFSHDFDSHLFLKGFGYKYLKAAARYLPDGYFFYRAPRFAYDKHGNQQPVPPYIYDNKGEHQFKKPVKSEMPVFDSDTKS